MDKKKLLVIISGGIRTDGITLSQLEYLKRIDKEKFNVFVVSFDNEFHYVEEKFKEANCEIVKLPNRRKHPFKYLNGLNKNMKKNKYDIIHIHGSSHNIAMELLLAKKNKIRIRIAHSRNTRCNNVIAHKLLTPIFNGCYNKALAVGTDAGKWMFGKKKFEVFHNGKDLEKYKFNKIKRKEVREKYKLNGYKVIATVGSFNEQKNQKFLIELTKKIIEDNKKIKLVLIGDGGKRKEYEEEIKELGIEENVLMLGRIENVNEILNGMDIMLLPSLYEGVPNVALEWQANGLKSIISDSVTTECAVSDLVSFLSINNYKKWISEIEKTKIPTNDERKEKSDDACENLKKNGFEIKSSVKRLEKIYSNEK